MNDRDAISNFETSDTMVRDDTSNSVFPSLPPVLRRRLRSEPDYYGASGIIARGIGLEVTPPSWASWVHGVHHWNPAGQVNDYLPRPFGSSASGLVARDEWAAHLQASGARNVHAVGVPFLYADRLAPPVERLPGSLLLMPSHTLANTRETRNGNVYLDGLSSVLEGFEDVAACVHPACVDKGYWTTDLAELGVPVVRGATVDDANALFRMHALFSRFESMTTDSMGSHVFYAAYCGVKVSVWGEPVFIGKVEDPSPWWQERPELKRYLARVNHDLELRKRFSEFYVHPLDAMPQFEIASRWMGQEYMRDWEELAHLLGWNCRGLSRYLLWRCRTIVEAGARSLTV